MLIGLCWLCSSGKILKAVEGMPMQRFVEGVDRRQVTLLPPCLDDCVTEENPVRVVEAFVDELDLGALGFAGVVPEVTGRPSYTTPRPC